MADPTTRRAEVSGADVDPARLVFVGGLHRSVTTPLGRVLADHPCVSGLVHTGVQEDEGQHLQRVYPAARVHGGPGRFALDPRSHLTEESPLLGPTTAQELWAAWAPYWQDPASPLLVEKSPPNMVMGRFLQAAFPGSALVVIVRHPVVVALSTYKWRRLASRHWWRHATIHQMIAHWFAACDWLTQDAPHLQRLRVLRYEDLLAEPERELAQIQDLLGLEQPFTSDLLHHGHSDRYEQRWHDLARTPWGAWVRRRVREDFAERAAAFGYDVDEPGALLPWTRSGLP